MANDANIKAVITAEDRASGVLKRFGDDTVSIGDKIGTALRAGAVATVAAAGAAVAFGVSSVKAFAEAQAGIAQTNAVLASTKGIAGVTAEAVDNLSKALQRQTTFSDEDVRSVENLLLTFTAITKDIFPQATKTVLNMATALGEDTKSASIQLGKALQDPILGVTALRRVGVNFNEAQKDVIKNLVETGHQAEAQKAILKELETEFGNSAEAARHTFGGSLKALKNQINDVQEAVGETITKALQPFIQKAADTIASIDWKRVIDNTIKALKDFVTELEEVWQKIDKIYQQVEHFLKPSLVALYHTVEEKLIPTLKRLWKEVLEPLLPIIGKVFVAELKVMIDAINIWIRVTTDIYNALLGVKNFLVNDVAPAFEMVANFVTEKFRYLKDHLMEVIGELIGFFATLPIMLPIYVAEAFAKMISLIVSLRWSDIFSGIWQGMQTVWDHVTQIVNNAWHWIHDLKWGDLFTGIGKSLANGLIDLIEGALKGALAGLPGNIEKKIHLPRFAGGVKDFSGGLAIVGERGPELVNLPRGSDVIPNNQIVGTNKSSTINININAGALMGTDVEARKFAQIIVGHIKDIAASKTQTVNQVLGM